MSEREGEGERPRRGESASLHISLDVDSASSLLSGLRALRLSRKYIGLRAYLPALLEGRETAGAALHEEDSASHAVGVEKEHHCRQDHHSDPQPAAGVPDPHGLLLAAVAASDERELAIAALLLDVAASLSVPKQEAHHSAAASLALTRPSLFRKLGRSYEVGGAPGALIATRALLTRGEVVEAALLVRAYELDEHVEVKALISMLVQKPSNIRAAMDFVAGRTRLQLELVRVLIARRDHAAAARYIRRAGLRCVLPLSLAQEVAFGIWHARNAWLVSTHNVDLIDGFFAHAAHEIRSAELKLRTNQAKPPDLPPDSPAAEDDEDALWEVALTTAQWLKLLRFIATQLVRRGAAWLAVQSAVRHGVEATVAQHLCVPIAAEDRARALAVTPEDLVLGRPWSLSTAAYGASSAAGGRFATARPPHKQPRRKQHAQMALAAARSGVGPPPAELQVAPSRIHTVDGVGGLRSMLEHMLHGEGAVAAGGALSGSGATRALVGLDAEWVDGQCGGGGRRVMQWLQLGCRGHAWLLDVPALTATSESQRELANALRLIFSDPRLLKLGFGLAADLRELRAAHPCFDGCVLSVVTPHIDIANEWARHSRCERVACERRAALHAGCCGTAADSGDAHACLQGGEALDGIKRGVEGETEAGDLPGGQVKQPTSLSAICAALFGSPLDKAMRMTNWSRRPLAPQQAAYAALDALVLCRVFAELERRRLRRGTPTSPLASCEHEVHCACTISVVAPVDQGLPSAGGGARGATSDGMATTAHAGSSGGAPASSTPSSVRLFLHIGRTFAQMLVEET